MSELEKKVLVGLHYYGDEISVDSDNVSCVVHVNDDFAKQLGISLENIEKCLRQMIERNVIQFSGLQGDEILFTRSSRFAFAKKLIGIDDI